MTERRKQFRHRGLDGGVTNVCNAGENRIAVDRDKLLGEGADSAEESNTLLPENAKEIVRQE